MSDLVVLGLKIGFLALLWLFVIFAINVMRADLFGRRVPAPETPAVAAAAPAPAPVAPEPVSTRGRRGRQTPRELRITAGPQAGLVMPIGAQLLIGRTNDSDLVLDDQYMSTRHAVLRSTKDGIVVEDLGSTNGTYVNEQRITTPTILTPADTLRIGRTIMALDR